ncbi:IS607 family element RNA-guided endonuclease TnpB [Micromonospora thermarum]|uniref:IS200/IS605 family element transposase accessory protein TnpB n=1 Tax=Micromonospora thermarum TaxID=2720024 RepID=A0ABX0YZT8_9ACTN|nr:IS607 family element RNA-guided endonuclease TnpB [Micromonospora thermarum]NJP31007.1 IS200/IS605 family element transposase accessory protein TnpB [Micromonospora thermarum]
MSARVMQAYRFALDPTPGQVRDLERHAGAARFAFNWALAAVKANLAQREVERSYGVADDELTPALGWNLPALRRAWNTAKGQVAPWWAECSKEAFNTGLDGVARALKNFSDSRNGKRAGRRVGFPRFRARRRATPSVRFTTGPIRVEADRKRVTLPRLGTVKLHESARKLARRLEAGTARIVSATVRREAGRWFVSFTCEVKRAERAPARPHAVVGVDVGVTHLAVLSTGELVDNPRHLAAASRRLRRLARRTSRCQGPDRRTGARPSRRWDRARAGLARAHRRVANLRRDGLHKLTTRLTGTYGTVVIEDLNVAGMLGNRKLAKAISDCGFGEIRRLIAYKTTWNGGRLVTADRYYPSSKTCSGCGAVKPKLPLQVRTFTCEHCGLSLDRDLNAANNLAQLVTSTTGTGVAGDPTPQGANGRGADQKTTLAVAGGDETSTPHRHQPDKTGTFVRQRANH